MLVRVKLKERKSPDQPFEVPLPTFTHVLYLVDEGIGYVWIPDTEHPELHEHESATLTQTSYGAALVGLGETGHKAWHAHLDNRYKEHKGKFRPEVPE